MTRPSEKTPTREKVEADLVAAGYTRILSLPTYDRWARGA